MPAGAVGGMSQAAEMDIRCALLEARDLARLTQAELARRAGTTQPAVAAYESGRAVPSWRMLDRLLEACGLAARLRLQPRHLEIDRELDAMLAKTPAERLWAWGSILEPIAARATPVVVIGAAALVAHGVPIPVKALDLAFGSEPDEIEGAIALLEALFARYYPTGYDDRCPSRPAVETVTLPGARTMTTFSGSITVWPGELEAVRGRAVAVAVPGGTVWVAALSDIDPPPEDADLVRRYLDRLAARTRFLGDNGRRDALP